MGNDRFLAEMGIRVAKQRIELEKAIWPDNLANICTYQQKTTPSCRFMVSGAS